MFPTSAVSRVTTGNLKKLINSERDATYFKSSSPAYRNISTYIDLLCENISGSHDKVLNSNYQIKDELFRQCAEFMGLLSQRCDETDLKLSQGAGSLRFGHVAFRDWFSSMESECKSFIDKLAVNTNDLFREELSIYLMESFGNKMRIDYGTGHELNFIIFTMGLCCITDNDFSSDLGTKITADRLQRFVKAHGWDLHALFAHQYLRLCRKIQMKFRLEPAGSRGVYNIDDFQYLPFLFGTSQLIGCTDITTSDFYLRAQVDRYKGDYIFFEAIDYILTNKKGPFDEHSYTLWGFTALGSWDNIFRRVKSKFKDNVLGPFPIIQHFLFGSYILTWS